MDYEKAYKELVGKIDKAYLYALTDSTRAVLEEIRPELREVGDEEVRKAMIDFFKHERDEVKEGIAVFHYGVRVERMLAWLEKRGEQKPAEWSEEDKVMFDEIIDFFENGTVKLQHDLSLYASWLKTLKGRIQPQPKQEWSKEDSYMLGQAIKCVNNSGKLDISTEEIEDWLKSLKESALFPGRPQSTWKPSGEQMYSILCAVKKMKESACYDSELVSLFNDLKKLKG